jgi:DnaJ-class molecular chaperone
VIANAIRPKWKFMVKFEDEETGEIAGTLGEAADREECEVLVEDEMEYRRLRGYIRATAEAVELCEQCEGEGSIPVEDDIVSICDACGGRIGILSTFKRGRGAEMMSTQSHLRAAS